MTSTHGTLIHYFIEPLLRIRLLFRCGISKGGNCKTSGFNAQNARVSGQVAAKAPRIAELGHETDIGECWTVAETKFSACCSRVDHLFQSSKTEVDPVLCPTVYLFVVLLILHLDIVQHPKILDRM